MKKSKPILIILASIVILTAGAYAAYIYVQSSPNDDVSKNAAPTNPSDAPKETQNTPAQPTEKYKGETATVADTFSVKVPNGWRASVSTKPSFRGVMFARPNSLESLVYNQDVAPAIDYNGIPSWNGLTEHFFIIKPTSAQQFNPADHLEVSSEPFTFNDGVVGQRYYVVKHAEEAKKWGGLQKDTEWQGRTYIYEKDGKRIEAHLAVYPSSSISIPFYDDVVRTIGL